MFQKATHHSSSRSSIFLSVMKQMQKYQSVYAGFPIIKKLDKGLDGIFYIYRSLPTIKNDLSSSRKMIFSHLV